MAKKVESIKHPKDKRVHIPSKEEAGYEDANPKVKQGKKVIELSKNPVVHRGQDPELFWLNKYGNDDRDDLLRVDIRSLYRHEHIAPETLIKGLYTVTEEKSAQENLFSVNELFGNALEKDELDKVSEYYHHQDGWTNRLIQGDSHLVMASMLEREGMAGQVQTIYVDPPYGIKYGSNWQIKLNNRDVKDGNDEALTGEPEQIKAFRDTWELGIHSYLSYLRDRLLIAKELLTESGSCFVQISDENVHLVRSILDEVFGSENFVSLITFRRKTGVLSAKHIGTVSDYLIWYSKDIAKIKIRKLFEYSLVEGDSIWSWVELEDGTRRKMSFEEINNHKLLPKKSKVFRLRALSPAGFNSNATFKVEYRGKMYNPPHRTTGESWATHEEGMKRMVKLDRVMPTSGGTLDMIYYLDDYPITEITNLWANSRGSIDKLFVVQTDTDSIQRCLLMTTDPGDLVLDPTCGSGTTAYVAEQFGRRWITIDTSRIALNIAKQRLMTAAFLYYKLYDVNNADIRQGFLYKTIPHITLKSLANDEPPATETMYDKPDIDNKRLRVSGPFTVETLQNFEPINPAELDTDKLVNEDASEWGEKIKQHLLSTGIKNGRKDERVGFTRVELLADSYLHAEGFFMNGKGEKKAYFHIGPKFGTVSKTAVNEAVKACRMRGDAQWLVILGFSFESDIEGDIKTMSIGNFEVTKCRIHDDLLQEGLKKKPAKNAASFVTIGEPDIKLHKKAKSATVEIQGLDIYDPIKDEVKARNVNEIAYWMVDDDYDGSNFVVKQVFFCGGDKDEFDKWKKGLSELSKKETKRNAERTLKIEIDDEAFDRLYGHISHPIEIKKNGHRIAVRVISQFGEETTKVITV
jgi:adenine-specific DNA-methyltransferase